MANLVASLTKLPLEITVGWMVWIAWSTAQMVWYRRARVEVSVLQPVASSPKPRPRRRPRAIPTDNLAAGSIFGLSETTGDVNP